MAISEPDRWVSARRPHGGAADGVIGEDGGGSTTAAAARPLGELREIFGSGPWRSRALVGLGLATVGLATFWGIFAWSKELASMILGAGLSDAQREQIGNRAYLLINFTGGLMGLLAFAPLASWRGRRFAFAVYHIGAAVTAPACFLWARTYVQAFWLLPLMAFFVLGMHAGYAIYFPELFPTRLRATGSSRLLQPGAGAGGGDPAGERFAGGGDRVALGGCRDVGIVLGGAADFVFAPETRGRELPE